MNKIKYSETVSLDKNIRQLKKALKNNQGNVSYILTHFSSVFQEQDVSEQG